MFDIVNQQSIEQVGVRPLQRGEVHVLVDICSTAVDHPHGSHALCFQALHDMGYETTEVLGNSLVGGERGTWNFSISDEQC